MTALLGVCLVLSLPIVYLWNKRIEEKYNTREFIFKKILGGTSNENPKDSVKYFALEPALFLGFFSGFVLVLFFAGFLLSVHYFGLIGNNVNVQAGVGAILTAGILLVVYVYKIIQYRNIARKEETLFNYNLWSLQPVMFSLPVILITLMYSMIIRGTIYITGNDILILTFFIFPFIGLGIARLMPILLIGKHLKIDLKPVLEEAKTRGIDRETFYSGAFGIKAPPAGDDSVKTVKRMIKRRNKGDGVQPNKQF